MSIREVGGGGTFFVHKPKRLPNDDGRVNGQYHRPLPKGLGGDVDIPNQAVCTEDVAGKFVQVC